MFKENWKKDETGIAKGVVLDAALFIGSQNHRCDQDGGVPDKSKDHELVSPGQISNSKDSDRKNTTNIREKTEKMTLGRKIGFAFSFLPSCLFILSFAVFIPCRQPGIPDTCLKAIWTRIFNDSTYLTSPSISTEVIASISESGVSLLMSLNQDTGDVIWNKTLDSIPRHIDCESYDANADGISDCLLTDIAGSIAAINTSNGHVFWKHSLGSISSVPVILSDCDDYGIKNVAAAVHSSSIKMLLNGGMIKTLPLDECKSIPQNLFSWTHDNKTDLLFTCETADGHNSLRQLKHSILCSNEKFHPLQTNQMLNSLKEGLELKDILLIYSAKGISVWSESLIVFFDNDANEIWRTKNYDHSQEQRYLIQGNFAVGEYVCLISMDKYKGVMVTLLNSSDGENVFTWSNEKAELKKAVKARGKSQDHLIFLLEYLHSSTVEANISEGILNYFIHDVHVAPINADIPRGNTQLERKIAEISFLKKNSTISAKENTIFLEKNDITQKESVEKSDLAVFVKENSQSMNLKLLLSTTTSEQYTEEMNCTRFKSMQAENWDFTLACPYV